MIIVTAPIALTEVNQPLFPLAWKAKNMGAESYVASETHVGYLIDPNHVAMLDKATIAGIVKAGGDIENLPLFIEIDLTEEVPAAWNTGEEAITWGDYTATPTIDPLKLEKKLYIEADKPASIVIASGLEYKTVAEIRAMQQAIETEV